jgi:multiple sugar transport system substrate-binding protein
MPKPLFCVTGLVLTIAVLLTGCNSNPNRASTGETITVTLSSWQSSPTERNLLQQVLNSFEEKHPNIKVKYEIISDQYMDVIRTRLIGEAAPDVFYLDGAEAPALMNKGVLEPLNLYITKDFDVADFEVSLINVFKYKNTIYGIPKDYSTLALFYNKKMFQEAGLAEVPKTWSQFLEYSRKLTIDKNDDGKIDQYGFGVAPELARQCFMIKAFGGQLVDSNGNAAFATEAGIKGLELVVNQYQNDQSSVQPSDVGTNSGNEMFGQGKVAMVIEGVWALPYLAETFPSLEFGTAEVPSVNGEKSTVIYTVAYVMNRQAKNKQAAWKLISYLTGKAGMKQWTSKGLALPTRKSVSTELGYAKDPLRAPLVAGVSYAIPWQAGENLPTITNSFNNQFISALLNQQPLEQAMKRAQETANQEIQASE